VLEAVRDCGICLVGPVDLLSGVCRCRLHCHLWVKLEAEVGGILGFFEWQWGRGVIKGQSRCQPEV